MVTIFQPVFRLPLAGTAKFIAEQKDADYTAENRPVIATIETLTPQPAATHPA